MWELASLRRAGVVALVSAALLLVAALLFGALRASAQTECAAARVGPAEAAAAPEPAACRASAQALEPAAPAPRFPTAGAGEPIDYLQRGRTLAVQALGGFASALTVVGATYWAGRRRARA